MNVFISWSGTQSREIAERFAKFIKRVVQPAKPWISTQNIGKGAIWFDELSKAMDTDSGVVLLTRSNLASPWIHFEAGALFKGLLQSRIRTVLIGVEATQIKDPISRFQHTLMNPVDMLELVKSINSGLGSGAIDPDTLKDTFDAFWPAFEKEVSATPPDDSGAAMPKPSLETMVSETLLIVRDLANNQAKPLDMFPTGFLTDLVGKPTVTVSGGATNVAPSGVSIRKRLHDALSAEPKNEEPS